MTNIEKKYTRTAYSIAIYNLKINKYAGRDFSILSIYNVAQENSARRIE